MVAKVIQLMDKELEFKPKCLCNSSSSSHMLPNKGVQKKGEATVGWVLLGKLQSRCGTL